MSLLSNITTDTEGRLLKGSSQDFSLRPNPTKTVYVYRGDSQHWSGNQLLETLMALVDISKTNVVCLSDNELLEGKFDEADTCSHKVSVMDVYF